MNIAKMFSRESFYKLQTLQMINFEFELGLFRLVAYSSLKIPIAEDLNPTYHREFPPEISIQTLTFEGLEICDWDNMLFGPKT